jgi:hypothetical protein
LYCIIVVASFYLVVKPPPPPRVKKAAFRVLFQGDNKKRTTRRLINSIERVISLSFSFDDAKKDHPSLCFVLFRCSSFAQTNADDVFFSLTSSKKHQISSDF